jgi:HlyD family secretion protein
MSRTSKPLLIGLGLALAAGAVAFVLHRRSASDESPVHYETAAVDRGPIVSKITATGTLSALVTVQVGSQVSGRLQEVLVDWNSEVKKGQVIARIDPQLFKAALEQTKANHGAALANLARSEVQAEEAERQRVRARGLADQKLVPAAEAETAESSAAAARAQVEASRASVKQASASLIQAQVNLGYTTIVSPIDGVVISRSVDVGQTVAASLQAPTLFAIAEDLRKMQVDASVSEADVGRLTPGMEASFTVDAFPGERFRGVVRQIRNAPQTVQNVVTYAAIISVSNPDLKLRPGMTASVAFVHAERRDALRIRNAALRFRPSPELIEKMLGTAPGDDGKAHARAGASVGKSPEADDPSHKSVWALRAGKPQRVTIQIGVSDGTLTEVLDGPLRERDNVITEAVDSSGSSGGGGARPGGGGNARPFRMF